MCSEQSGKVEVWDSATRNLTIIHLVTQCHRTCFSVAIVMPALAEKHAKDLHAAAQGSSWGQLDLHTR